MGRKALRWAQAPMAEGKLYPHGVSDLKLDFHLDGASGCCGNPVTAWGDAPGGFVLPAPNFSPSTAGWGVEVGAVCQCEWVCASGLARLCMAAKNVPLPRCSLESCFPLAAAFILNSCLVIQWFLEVELLLFGAGSACVASAWTGNLGSLGNLEVWDLCGV